MVFFLRSALSIMIVFLTYSIGFLSENDIFFYIQPFSESMLTGPTNLAIGVSCSRQRVSFGPEGLVQREINLILKQIILKQIKQ